MDADGEGFTASLSQGWDRNPGLPAARRLPPGFPHGREKDSRGERTRQDESAFDPTNLCNRARSPSCIMA